MSRATISTGAIQVDTRKRAVSPPDGDSPMHIAILGDFSGRASRGLNEWKGIAERKAHPVDRDNFDELFEKLKVTLELPVADKPIPFGELDDLHPDYLYDRIALFDELRALKRKLRNPSVFDEAAREIQQWTSYQQQQVDSPGQAEPGEARPAPENLLDAILKNSDPAECYLDSPIGNINRIIKDIVAPYVTAKTDPRLPELEAAVDSAVAELMRKIMHATGFQALEAAWRSLYLLVRRLETNSKLKLFLLDISRDEIISDIGACESDIQASGLYKLLVERNGVAGGISYAVINADYIIGDTKEDLLLASALAGIGLAADAHVIAGGSPRLAGCDNLSHQEDPDDWRYQPEERAQKQWAALREQPIAAHLALAAPRFLLRLPYGGKTSPIDSFDFEELSDTYFHEYYLWGNAAWLVTLALAQNYSRHGWAGVSTEGQEITDIAVHVYSLDGDSVTKSSAEVFLTDRAAGRLVDAGLLPVRSVKNSTSVLLTSFISLRGSVLQQGRQ